MNGKNVQRYNGKMDETGRIIWRAGIVKYGTMYITESLIEFICQNVLYVHEKTFRRKLADANQWTFHELELFQRWAQSEELKSYLTKKFDLATF